LSRDNLWKASVESSLPSQISPWEACGKRNSPEEAANRGFCASPWHQGKGLSQKTAKQIPRDSFAVYRPLYLGQTDHLGERSWLMSSDGAEVRELKPRQEGRVSDAGDEQLGLLRSERDHNRAAAQRITTNEAERCLPALRKAAADVELGQQMRHLAAYTGDTEVEEKLRRALEELAQAAAV
jgi:hypothetical protein